MNNRKPHLLRAKQEIVALIDGKITEKRAALDKSRDRESARDLAIFIRQRNRIAKDADMPLIPIGSKTAQRNYTVEV